MTNGPCAPVDIDATHVIAKGLQPVERKQIGGGVAIEFVVGKGGPRQVGFIKPDGSMYMRQHKTPTSDQLASNNTPSCQTMTLASVV